MKTMVLFRLEDGSYVSCDSERLAVFPRVGHTYLLNGQEFDVVKVIEPLGRAGGNKQLLELFGLDSRDAGAAAGAMATMTSLDRPAVETKLALAEEPDNVVLVRLTSSGKKRKTRIGELSFDTSRLQIAAGSGAGQKPGAKGRKDKSSTRTTSKK